MENKVSVIKLPNETVESSGFRYVVILKEGVTKPSSYVFPTLYHLVQAKIFNEALWPNLEASLTKDGVYTTDNMEVFDAFIRVGLK